MYIFWDRSCVISFNLYKMILHALRLTKVQIALSLCIKLRVLVHLQALAQSGIYLQKLALSLIKSPTTASSFLKYHYTIDNFIHVYEQNIHVHWSITYMNIIDK